jgi:catechol 2,3-dioxygenase-like lactoylglutathione lyase family enzyme
VTPPHHRLLELALYCDDPTRTATFYRRLLGAAVLFEDERLVALDAGQSTVLLLFRRGGSAKGLTLPNGRIPPHDGSGPVHLAFGIGLADFDEWEARLNEMQVPIESRVDWARGGKSLYFRDPDGHSVELATPGTWLVY